MWWYFLWAFGGLVVWRIFFAIFPRTIVELESLSGWAVVTGATDGIGKAFAQELARRGFNLVLVSRSVDKLESCSNEIKSKFKVSTDIIQADFSAFDKETYLRIKNGLAEKDIGILVNNVGTGLNHPEMFHEIETNHENYYQDVVNINIVSAINMTRAILPGMVQRKKGLIINVSSQMSYLPQPLNCLYAATKSFINKFSEDLSLEYRNHGVHVHVLTTGLVKTKLTGFVGEQNSNFFSPTPTAYVRSALDQVTRHRVTDGYLGHSVTSTILFIPFLLFPELKKLSVIVLSYARNYLIKNCDECQGRKQL